MPTLILDDTPSPEAPKPSNESNPLWSPLPGPQTSAYESNADIVGYGGAAGGGKSHLLLGTAVTTQARSLIFRREKTQLRDLWEKLLEVIGPHGRTNETLHVVRDLPDGRSVELGGVKDEGDWKTYQGRAYDFHGFDELTEFTERQFRTLIAWNRTVIPGQRCRVIAAFNPPTTAEGEWVIRFFAAWLDPQHPNPAEPGELRWYAQVGEDEIERPDGEPFEYTSETTGRTETIIPKSRTFFPAQVTDNPYLLETGYVATLQGLPEPLRSQMLYGDFSIGLEDDEWQVIPTRWVLAAQERGRYGNRPDMPIDQLGLDVARGGRDKSVMAPRRGLWLDSLVRLPKPKPPAVEDGQYVSAHALAHLAKTGSMLALIVIDGIGVGTAPYDVLKQIPDVRVYSAIASEKATALDGSGRQRFLNKRSQWWWHMREILNPEGAVQIALPDDPELRADLCAPRWKALANRVIQVEPREEIVKRLGRSPDAGTACVLAFAPVVVEHKPQVRPVVYDNERVRLPEEPIIEGRVVW